jgi:hypothetical protein
MPDTKLMKRLIWKLNALTTRGAGTYTMLPDDEDIAVEGYEPEEIEACYRDLVDRGYLASGSEVDQGGHLIYTGLSPVGRDFLAQADL